MSGRWFLRAAMLVIRRPWLVPTGIVQVFRLAPTGWWKRSPYLPIPEPGYLRFRLQTQYGEADREPEPADVVSYLRWCRRYGRLTG